MSARGSLTGLAVGALILSGLAWAGLPVTVKADTVVLDLSDHRIRITSSFTGSELLLFGALESEPDADMIVVVRGPEETKVVRRKERTAGIWINRAAATFENVPTYYAVLSTGDPAALLRARTLERHRIGPERLGLEPLEAGLTEAEAASFTDALIRALRRDQLYAYLPGSISVREDRLFRARVYFPSNVRTGNYSAEVYLVRRGRIVSAESLPLFVTKTGIERWLFDMAQQRPIVYGIAAVLAAVLSGWLAAVAFRKT